MANGLYISYLRCSTVEQMRSGLGIEAQRAAVASYLNGGNWQLIAEYVEQESGKRNNRPQLIAALNRCKATDATLVISRLDRLSRNAAFITALQDSKVKFVCCDMPEANEFTITIMAALAQQERKLISNRTKEALTSAKARGVQLGCAKGTCNVPVKDRANGGKISGLVRAELAAERTAFVQERVQELHAAGLSLRAIAKTLTDEHFKAPRGNKWNATAISRILHS